jgi:Pentapeptide repeats (9 copies)
MEPGEADVDWPRCTADARCIGVQVSDNGPCLAHLDAVQLGAQLQRLGSGGNLDARGVRFGATLLERVLATLSRSQAEPAVFKGDAWFDRATFEAEARFDHVTFVGAAEFTRTTFEDAASFARAIFKDAASFAGATFKGHAAYGGTTFERSAAFNQVTFKRNASFGGARFQGVAWFGEARVQDGVQFVTTIFEDDAWFGAVTFEGHTTFERATFRGEAWFGEATFNGEAWFIGTTFDQARTLGPMQASGQVMLDNAVFRQRVRIEIAAAEVTCCSTRFLEGGDLRLRWARILLDDADFAAPSILSAAQPFLNLNEQEFVTGWQQAPGPPRANGQPWLASLRRADVAGLALGNVDLQVCHFAGAHNLDRLRLESGKRFASTPEWKAVESGWAWPPVWWWTHRQVLAEEHEWRAEYEHGIRQVDWHNDETWPAGSRHWVANAPLPRRLSGRRKRQLARIFRDARRWRLRLARLSAIRAVRGQQRRDQAGEIVNLYRALRKGREDNKDEPGAADFYYGEMELRRRSVPPSVERLILWMYWLVSGYGLRAWRALLATLVVLAAFAGLMVGGGFQHSASSQVAWVSGRAPTQATQSPDTSFPAALVYGARTAIGLTRDPQPTLTRLGDVLQIAIRIIVPVLLGLAVLSIRGRVKR